MRKLLAVFLFTLVYLTPSFAQIGSAATGNPVAVNSAGQPLAGVTVAVCSSYPGVSPSSLCSGGSLVPTYTDISVSTACAGTLTALSNPSNPTIGSGCSNPGLTDGLGNVIVYALGGIYWCEYTGPGVFGIQVQACIFPILQATITPPGVNKNVIFNDNGAFGAKTGFTFDKASGNFATPGTVTAQGFVSTASGAFFVNSPFGATIKAPVAGQNGFSFDTATGAAFCSVNGGAYATCASTVSPLTTKGDIYVRSTVDARLPVGADGQVVTADSTQALGVKWATPTASPLTTKGDIFVHGTVDARFPVGADGTVPFADSTQTLGLKWGFPNQQFKYNPINYGAKFDVQFASNCDTTASSTTVTCQTGVFSASDVGKIIVGVGYLSPSGCPAINGLAFLQATCLLLGVTGGAEPTITAFISATQVTVSASATGAPQIAHKATIVWGTDDDAALESAWTAASAACQTLYMPQGYAFVHQRKFNSYAGCISSGNYSQPAVRGDDKNSTLLIPLPNFDFSGCTPACFLGAAFEVNGYFSVWGMGLSPAGGNNQILAMNNGGFLTEMDFEAWCQYCTNSIGVKFIGGSAGAQFGGVESFGYTNIVTNAGVQGSAGLYNFVGFGSFVGLEEVGGQAQSTNNTFGGSITSVLIDAGGILDSNFDAIYQQTGAGAGGNGPIIVNGGLNAKHLVPSGFSPLIIGASGFVTSENVSWPNTNATVGGGLNGRQIYNGAWMLETSGGVFQDHGGNKFAGAALTPGAPTYVQNNSARVSGSGTSSAVVITPTGAAHAIFVIQSWVNAAANSLGCTDTQGNTYVQYKADVNTTATFGTARRGAVWYTKSTASTAADTITCTVSAAATFFLVAAVEVSGQNTSTTLDGTPSTVLSSGTALGAFSAGTTGVTNDLILMMDFQDNVTALTPDPVNSMPLTAPTVNGDTTWNFAYGPIAPTGQLYSALGNLVTNADFAVFFLQVEPASTVDSTAKAIAGTTSTNTVATAASNYVLSGGWGNTPTATIVLGKNPQVARTRYTITAGTAALGANPTITFTYPVAFVVAPQCGITQDGGTQAAVANPFTIGVTTSTSVVMTYTGTPGASNTLTGLISCQ